MRNWSSSSETVVVVESEVVVRGIFFYRQISNPHGVGWGREEESDFAGRIVDSRCELFAKFAHHRQLRRNGDRGFHRFEETGGQGDKGEGKREIDFQKPIEAPSGAAEEEEEEQKADDTADFGAENRRFSQ